MSERQAKPIVTPLSTRPGESIEHTGSREVTKLLPSILQTTVNKQFFDSTFEQLMSTGNLQPIKNIVGKQTANRDITDNYLIDNRSNDPYQFAQGFVNRNEDKTVSGTLAYDDLLRSLKYNEVETNNHNRVLSELGYTLDLPINYDMFVNHQKYFWLVDVMPPCAIKGKPNFNINIDDAIGETTYTYTNLFDGKDLTLQDGMRIVFSPTDITRRIQTVVGNTTFTAGMANGAVRTKVFLDNVLLAPSTYSYNNTTGVVTLNTAPALQQEVEIHTYYATSNSGTNNIDEIYIVDNVGQPGGIKFTKQFDAGIAAGQYGKRQWVNVTVYNNQEPSGFDADDGSFDFRPYDLREHRLTTRDYLVEQRCSTDQSAWARSNLWIHEDAAQAMLTFSGLDSSIYLLDKYRGVRPIIEFKENIEKYNTGIRHLANIDHALESTEDPAQTIVGKTSYSVTVSGITTEWSNVKGAIKKDKVRVTNGTAPNQVITYWECIQNHATPINPQDSTNRDVWQQIVPVELENDDLIIFFESANVAYKNKIFRVGGVQSSITLTEVYNGDGSNGATALVSGDKIVILNGFNTLDISNIANTENGEKDDPFSGAEIYWNGTAWVYGQQKEHRSAGILHELYDVDLIKLDDATTYPTSDYVGGYIFNFTHSTTNKFDDALGFKPEYVDYGNNPGLNFEVGLLHTRFNYTEQSPDFQKNLTIEITGNYYYKNLNNNRYYNGWSTVRDGQPVSRVINKTVTDATVPLKFDVGHNNFDKDRYFRMFKENDLLAVQSNDVIDTSRVNRLNGKLPNLYLNTNTTYFIRTQFPQAELEFVDMDGTTLSSGITRTAGVRDDFDLVIASPTIKSFKYRLAASPNNFGVVYLHTSTQDTNIKVTKNGVDFTNYILNGNILEVNSGLRKDDHYQVSVFTTAKYSDTAEGNFEVVDVHKFNPQNLTFDKVSYGDLLLHLKSQMTQIPTFTGEWAGFNNYRNIPHDHTFGGIIRQQPYSTELLNQLFTENDTDPISSLQYSSNSYKNFIRSFKTKIRQLNESVDITEPVYSLVDKTLEAINIGKNKTSAFARSQMAMYRDYEEANFSWVLNQTPTFDLPFTVNEYDDTFNHTQAWIQIPDPAGNHTWRALKYPEEYTFNNYQITITLSGITFPASGQNNLHFRWYKRDSVSFVPPSSVKLGLTRPFTPELRSNYSKDSTGTATDSVIVGHDGSIHVRNGTELFDRQVVGFDPVDAGLWDLELRISNNLGVELTSVVNSKQYWPNASRNTPYTWADFQDSIKSEYNKWKTENNVTNFNSSTYYSGTDKFTWNYSSVTPNIGGWRGLYRYFFNTDKPHTDPWEMMGYNEKPTWWDTYYSWTDAAKRTALITALKYGNISNPGLASNLQVYDLDYSYPSYDWATNTLVTLLGVLNDPVTASVVQTPSLAERQKDFVYGDWGPVEEQWRRSSEFKFASALALLRTRPLIGTNLYFKTNKRNNVSTLGYDNPQIRDIDKRKLTSWSNIELSDGKIIGAIIESVKIKDAGSGYTTTPTVTVFDNFGSGAEVKVSIKDGKLIAARITKQGQEYFNKPRLVLSSGNGILEAIIEKDTRRYFSGFSNSITSYALLSGTTTDVILQRFKNMTFNPIVKAGGFVNNNQNFILESSQDKGRVFVPEENFSTHLYVNKPDVEFFFGGIIINKTANGYTINGYDNSLGLFRYNAPATNGPSAKVTFSGTLQVDVRRYTNFENTISELDYNTELRSIQEVYDFIQGYGHYLTSLGFTQSWKNAGSNFGNWATGNSTQTLYLIPDPNKVTVQDDRLGYFDNLNTRYDGVYNIVSNLGKQISSSDIAINRSSMSLDEETVFETKETTTNMFGLRLYKVQMEHIFIFDNVTNFDDVIASSEIGQIHERIIWRGNRTKNWNGKLFTPGHIVNGNSILPNFDSVAGQLDQYYARTNTLSNKQISDVARFNSGYNRPNWADTLDLDDDSVYEFVKGTYKYKGTRYALDAFMRNKGLFNGDATADLNELWAVRMADFGDTAKRKLTEFQITPELLVTDPQPIRFISGQKYDVLSDIVIDIDDTSPLNVYNPDSEQFTTREIKTYDDQNQNSMFANDFINAGLPLLTETDYRTLNKEDFTLFPTETKIAYDFDGEWQEYDKWDSKTSYKLGDKVIHQGRVWEMLDPDGASGLTTANNPIELTGTVQLPIIPSAGQTLVVDGTTISLTKSATSTTLNVVTVDGSKDIRTNNVVAHDTTLILGQTSALASTITFNNSVVTTVFNDIVKTGTTVNPIIQGSATATLIIEGTTVNFNEQQTGTTNITAQQAYENTFNSSSWIQNGGTVSSTATTRISRIESLRSAYIAANSAAAWTTWITTYYANNAGLNISHLITLVALGGSTATAAQQFLDQDVILINNMLGTSFVGTQVASGAQVISPAQIATCQGQMNLGTFTDDIATYLKSSANATTTFAVTTVVAQQSATGFKPYSLTDIVNRINAAGISNITAGANASSQLTITKTTSTPSVAFNLTISVGTMNGTVGFNSAQETIQSQGTNTVTTPNLTQQQIVDQINNANVTGISASVLGNVLRLQCNLSQFFIGTGTANADIGLTSGVTPASTTTSTTSTSLTLPDILESINLATITGVTAVSANNKVKLISTNSTLVIGAGTANSTIGFTAQTYSATTGNVSNVFNAIVGSDGNQVFQQMTNDPNIFSIWVADNSEFGNYNLGHEIYQTMDFGMYTHNACGGIEDADEAQLDVTRQNGETQAHNLVVGDYILIRGSDTVPNIDGIHQVTRVDPNNVRRFYIDQYIETEGHAGNIYPLRKMRFSTFAALEADKNTKVNGVYKYNFAGVRQDNALNPIFVFVDNDGNASNPSSQVYKWVGTWNDTNGNVGDWEIVRSGNKQARNDLVNNVKLYDAVKQTTITNLETYDPVKGIIFGFIKNEIDHILTNDVANYNYNSLDGEIENINAWQSSYVGKRWWDLSTAVYLDYEQGSIDYMQNNWGRLFDGASIDIYEWTRSPVLPEKWSELVDQEIIIDGRVASGEAFSTIINSEIVYNWTEESYYNNRTKRNETVYYYWVKNKTNFSGARQYNVLQLSQLLADPTGFNLSWCATAGTDTLLLSGISNTVTENTVVQLDVDRRFNALPMQDWLMLAEDDPQSVIPEYLHIKVRDSLAGFNRFSVTTTFTTWSNSTSYTADAVVKEGDNYYISRVDSNLNNQPSADSDMSHWQRVYDFSFDNNTQIDDITILRSQPVPNLKLHKFNRYGHQVRPRQSLYRELEEARQNFVYTVNLLLSEVNVVDEINNWENAFATTFVEGVITYDINDYIALVDWKLTEKDADGNVTYKFPENTVPDLVYNTKQDYVDAGEPVDGSYVLIKNTHSGDDIIRSEMYHFINGADKLVFKEKATIELSEEVWLQRKFGHGFDVANFDVVPFDSGSENVISKLFDLLRTEIFINHHKVKYNKLWFKMLFTALLQNTADDFAFKTTYTRLNVKRPLLLNKKFYQPTSIEPVEEFFNSVKPFHTKLLSSMDSNTHGESTNIEIDEVSRNTSITIKYGDHTTRTWAGDTILSGGGFSSNVPTDEDYSMFNFQPADFEFDYDGNIFDQPDKEGWGEELMPVDYTENVSISVQTNPQGTVTAGATYSVNPEETGPRGLTFNDTGTKMFVVGTTGDDVNEYTLSVAFDLTSTVTFVDSYAVTECPNPTAVKFNTNGTKMFVTGVGNSNVHEYALTTGFDVSTAGFTQTLVTTVDTDNFGLDFKDDGTKMYITGDQNNKIYEFNLSSAFDISSATFNQDLSVTATDIEPFGIEWKPDGKKLFIVGTRGNGVDLFNVATPWDISTATHSEFYFIGGNPSGIHISPDGTKMFITGNTSDLVKSYTLSVPYEFTTGSTATVDSRAFRINMYEPQGLQESVAIVDASKTTTTANITATDTTIPVTDDTVLDSVDRGDGDIGLVPGVVWIGTERIEYSAVDTTNNQLLFCNRGTRGTSSQAHTSGATVTNAGPSKRIPTVQKFSHYENGLRLAYNDSGISLTAAGTSPEHAFIRNAGQGSI